MAGSSSRSIGVTVTSTSGWVAASWAMTPPDRVSEPVSLSGAPIAMQLERVAQAPAVDGRFARRPRDGHAGDHPHGTRARWPRRRRCGAR